MSACVGGLQATIFHMDQNKSRCLTFFSLLMSTIQKIAFTSIHPPTSLLANSIFLIGGYSIRDSVYIYNPHHASTHALTHARPSLPINADPNPAVPNLYISATLTLLLLSAVNIFQLKICH